MVPPHSLCTRSVRLGELTGIRLVMASHRVTALLFEKNAVFPSGYRSVRRDRSRL